MRVLLDCRAFVIFAFWAYLAWVGVFSVPVIIQYITSKYGPTPPLYVSILPYWLIAGLILFIAMGLSKFYAYLDSAAHDRMYGDSFLLYPIVGVMIWLVIAFVPVDRSMGMTPNWDHTGQFFLPESGWMRYSVFALIGLSAGLVILAAILLLMKKLTVKGLRRMLEK
jgi:hypothetical protein